MVVLAAANAQPQAFGRFGFSETPKAPGFLIDGQGFRAVQSGADTFRFAKPVRFHRDRSSAESAGYSCDLFAGDPQDVTVNLRAPGFEMVFPYGVDLHLASLNGPNLTAGDATYGPGTPAPESKWILVTFADRQPPILFVFIDGAQELQVTGSSGQWRLKTSTVRPVRLRICLPFGLDASTSNDVASLGKLAGEIKGHEDVWTRPAPVLQSTSYQADDKGVKVVWRFDKPGAIVPPAAILAKAAGYAVELTSPVLDIGHGTEEGPLVFSQSAEFSMHLPVRAVPMGRSIVQGRLEFKPASVSPLPTSDTVELALASLVGCRSDASATAASRALEEFFSKTAMALEPQSPGRLTYAGDGGGMESTAASALLLQATSTGMPTERRTPALLTSLLLRFDPMDWRLWVDGTARSRADAIAGLAAALDGDWATRAAGAMLHAGLAARQVLGRYLKGHGYPGASDTLPDPCGDFSGDLFSVDAPKGAFFRSLLSDVRILSSQELTVTGPPERLELAWPYHRGDEKELILMVGTGSRLIPGPNLGRSAISEVQGVVKLRFEPKGDGICSATLIRSGRPAPLPGAAPVPKYSE